MKILGIVQLTSGDAIRGVVSRRMPFWKQLKVENATAIEGRSGKSASVDGILWIPKTNVVFVQQLLHTVSGVSIKEVSTTEVREQPQEARVSARYTPV